MNGGIVVFAITKPLKSTSAVPIRIEVATAPGTLKPLFTISPALRVPDIARIDPTDKSIPPVMMANVIPKAKHAFDDTWRRTFTKFLWE